MDERIKRIKGANFNIDLTSQGKVDWKQTECPWNKETETNEHRCALNNTICEYFCGVKYLDSVLCSYPHKNVDEKVNELKGGNIGMELITQDNGNSKQTECPWNKGTGDDEHICGLRDISICKYFCGIKYLDSVLCSYPYENLTVLRPEEIDRPLKICPSCGRQHDANYSECPFCNHIYDI